MIREYLWEFGLHIRSQGLGWYRGRRADAYEIRLCLHVDLVHIPRAGAVQLWTTIFKYLIQLSTTPANSTDPCTYEKKFVNSIEVLIWSNRYEKTPFQDELNSPWNAISKAVIVFLFLPFFLSPFHKSPWRLSYLLMMLRQRPSSFRISATSCRRAAFSRSRNAARTEIWFSFSRRASRERFAASLFL